MAAAGLLAFASIELAKRNALQRTTFPGADLVRLACALCMPEASERVLGMDGDLRALLLRWGHDPVLVKDCLTMTRERKRLAASLDADAVARLCGPWSGRGMPPALAVLMCGDLSRVPPDKLKAIIPGDGWLVAALARGGHLRTLPAAWIRDNVAVDKERVHALAAGAFVETGRVSPRWILDNVDDDRDRIMLLSRFDRGAVTMRDLLSGFDDFEDFVDAATVCGLAPDTGHLLDIWSRRYGHGPAELARGLTLYNARQDTAEYDAGALICAMQGADACAVVDVIESASDIVGVEAFAMPHVRLDGPLTQAALEHALVAAIADKGWSPDDSACIAGWIMTWA